MRCTNYTLSQFGVYIPYPVRDGLAVIEHLTNAGYRIRIIDNPKKTLKTFVRAYPKGKYYLITVNHALALVDGQLFDYAEKGANLRRVLVAVQIFDKP